MNTDLRKKAKNDFVKGIFKLMNNVVFGKTMENFRKHRDIKLVTTEKRINYLLSQANYHTTRFFTENLLATEMKKTEIFMNKLFHLGLSILKLSKILIYEFWYDYVKPKHVQKVKVCSMDNYSFIVYIKTKDIQKNIAEDIKSRFDTSNYELDRLLPKGRNKKVIGLMKDQLGEKIIIKFDGLSAKTYSYLQMTVVKIKKQVFHRKKS